MKKAVILEGNVVSMGDVSWKPVQDVCDVTIYGHTSEDEKWDRIGDTEILLLNKIIADEKLLERFPEIRYIGVCATGYNIVDVEACKRHGVLVTNVPAYSTDSVVQLTVGLILNMASGISVHDRSVKEGDWIASEDFAYSRQPLTELAGKTLGIYGFGNIGRGVAKVARALGMHVLVHTANPSKYLSFVEPGLRFADENSLFSNSDIITLHCPLTKETEYLIRKETIDRMKDRVMLVNVSRGGLVNEADLADALRSGKVAAAGVDVISAEPMKADNPLYHAPNITITPHIAWATKEARERLVQIVADNIRNWEEGHPSNVVF